MEKVLNIKQFKLIFMQISFTDRKMGNADSAIRNNIPKNSMKIIGLKKRCRFLIMLKNNKKLCKLYENFGTFMKIWNKPHARR